MTQTLKNRDIPVTGKARQITAQDFFDFDLILTMDDDNYEQVEALAGDAKYMERVKRFTEFCVDPDHQTPEVPDPYYGGGSGFELVANMLEDGCRQLLDHVRKFA